MIRSFFRRAADLFHVKQEPHLSEKEVDALIVNMQIHKALMSIYPPLKVDLLKAPITLQAAPKPPPAVLTQASRHLHGCCCSLCTKRPGRPWLRGIEYPPPDPEILARQAHIKIMRGDLKNYIRKRIFRRDGYRCQYCLGWGSALKRKLTVDHKIPLMRGGTNDDDNLITACERCNAIKGNRLPDDPKWLAYLNQVRRNRR